MTDLTAVPWRTNSAAGKTIFAQAGREPSPDDLPIGMMDTPELAADACAAHNERLEGSRARRMAAPPDAVQLHGLTGVQFGDGNKQNNVFG